MVRLFLYLAYYCLNAPQITSACTSRTIPASGRHAHGVGSRKHPVLHLFRIFARTQARNLSFVHYQVRHLSYILPISHLITPIECDKSFTRSDALAKHMRMQHNIVPPAPGRGGNRKRKREEAEAPAMSGPEGYGAFKVEPVAFDLYDDRISPGLDAELQLSRLSGTPDIDEDSEGDDGIPEHLQVMQDPHTGLIMGRPPAMVKYLVMKAKHQHALREHASLIEELRAVRHEEQLWRDRKDQLLDDVLRATFGCVYLSRNITLPLK